MFAQVMMTDGPTTWLNLTHVVEIREIGEGRSRLIYSERSGMPTREVKGTPAEIIKRLNAGGALPLGYSLENIV